MFHMENRGSFKPYGVSVKINGRAIDMEIDTGASVSIISEETFKTICRNQKQN
jgi:predicted aspartyl protease